MAAKKKSQFSRGMHGAGYLSLLILSGFFLSAAAYDIQTMISLKVSIADNEKKREEVLAKKEELEITKNNLTNPDYIKYLSMGKYLVAKEGEQVFKFQAIDKNASGQE